MRRCGEWPQLVRATPLSVPHSSYEQQPQRVNRTGDSITFYWRHSHCTAQMRPGQLDCQFSATVQRALRLLLAREHEGTAMAVLDFDFF
jgi:hypothetical protein